MGCKRTDGQMRRGASPDAADVVVPNGPSPTGRMTRGGAPPGGATFTY
jgi:hypothetical protein